MKGTLGVFVIAISALIVGLAIGSAGNEVAPDAPKTLAGAKVAKPKNVILLVGDGMGISEITAARYYNGARKPLNLDRFKYTGFGTSWSVKPGTSAKPLPDYLPDSASTATQWATGEKTNDGRLAQTVTNAANVPGKPLKSIAEIMRARGMRIGSVTTTDLTDATPAAISSHVSYRYCQGPADMALCPDETRAAGGLGSIAEQAVNAKFDVLLGGGRARFAQPITGGPDAGKTVLDIARSRGYRYVGSAARLESANSSKKVLGLFNEEDMSTNWRGPATALGKGNAPVACTEGQRPSIEPSLAAMSRRALKMLDNEKGFFLQIEGGLIDKEAHNANPCGQIGETIAFDQAVGVALDFQRSHPGTLVIATADHSQSGMIVREDATGGGLPTGYSANLLTRDGQVLALTYSTTGYGDGRPSPPKAPVQYHSGAAVPVWAVGPGASRVLGTNDHTHLFDVMRGRP